MDNLLASTLAIIERSEILQGVAALTGPAPTRSSLGAANLRPLYKDEICRLEAQDNFCTDWSRIRVADGFDCKRVRHCELYGDVVLGCFRGESVAATGQQLPTGIYHSTLRNCVISHDALIRHVKLLAHYVVGDGACLTDCGEITCNGLTKFGNGTSLSLGLECGGREVPVFAEIDVETAACVASDRTNRDLLSAFARLVESYASRATSSMGIIGRSAQIRSTAAVRNSFIGSHARIDGAGCVQESSILSRATDPAEVSSGAVVLQSLLQWGARVSSLAVVERSVLTEHSSAERHAKITASLIGPNTAVAAGEVTSSLVGPFVSFHHQALLIATLWPEGKGNVAYGANVGSNHTSKAPDQEFRAGEGMFLGLGVNVKFPADFTQAPYSIIACGATTLPQKVVFPFSLINKPSGCPERVSPSYNEIIPAWLLTDNLYTVRRNEGKYAARNKVKTRHFEYRVFRPQIIGWMREACRRLQSVRPVKDVYTEQDIEGLGKNYMLEKYRRPAIKAYRFFIQYYALLQLKERAERLLDQGQTEAPGNLLSIASEEPIWEQARTILVEDFGMRDIGTALHCLPPMLEHAARRVESSKSRDDERGRKIIADYSAVHVQASDDTFVQQTWAEARRIGAEVQSLLERIDMLTTTSAAVVPTDNHSHIALAVN